MNKIIIIPAISSCLALLMLFTPLVWMKIGPGGYEAYGLQVPDIYIHGAYITGKDLRFWGINFAYKFQLTVILYFIISNLYAFLHPHKAKLITVINLVLLLLFPFWFWLYTDGVWANSDDADLTISLQYGFWIYPLLLALNIVFLFGLSRRPATKGLMLKTL